MPKSNMPETFTGGPKTSSIMGQGSMSKSGPRTVHDVIDDLGRLSENLLEVEGATCKLFDSVVYPTVPTVADQSKAVIGDGVEVITKLTAIKDNLRAAISMLQDLNSRCAL